MSLAEEFAEIELHYSTMNPEEDYSFYATEYDDYDEIDAWDDDCWYFPSLTEVVAIEREEIFDLQSRQHFEERHTRSQRIFLSNWQKIRQSRIRQAKRFRHNDINSLV